MKTDIAKRTITKNLTKLITWYTHKNGLQFGLNFGSMDIMDLLLHKAVIDYHYFCRFELENMSIYEILSLVDLTQSVHDEIRFGMHRR